MTLSDAARRAIAAVAARSSGGPVPATLRITLNFHPDRWLDGVPILVSLARDGRYRSQFETGTSNGGLTAHVGGDRWRWEHQLFDGAYDDAPPNERPVYGALSDGPPPLGGAPRFGSAYLSLRPDAVQRATFCYPDSALNPDHVGTAGRAGLVALAAASAPADPLDGYVEAHVHGGVVLHHDVERLTLDPCYRGTDVEAQARELGVPVGWHEGRVLDVPTLRSHATYRGPEVVALGEQLAVDGLLDAAVIGRAVRAGGHDPRRLKQLWHVTAQWGRPRG